MAQPPSSSILHITIITLTCHFFLLTHATKNPDFHPLLAFKIASDTSNKLTSWNITTDLCTWYGVSCLRNRVSRLVLEDLDLHGSFEPLTSLTQLRVLSLKRNSFNGPIPNLSNLTSLRLLFLSYNNFSGEFPESLTSLTRLYRLDLSHNNISGEIPVNVNSLSRLLTLRLDGNQIEGHIPNINLSNLQDFNVSGNILSGRIPELLSGFPDSSFTQNPSLCGKPLQKCKDVPALASSLVPLPSSSGSMPGNKSHGNGGPRMGTLVLITIILGDVLVLAIVSLLLYCYFWRNHSNKMEERKEAESNSKSIEGENQKMVYIGQQGLDKGNKMVFFEGAKRFELEDLLRASAEMLGKGTLGTVYKAVLDDGSVVAVKRLKEVQIGGKKEFEQRMEVLGKLRHSNIVCLKAYYFARDEKLLVFDYMVNGSLFWLLHGNRGPGRTPLDWTTRLKIASGAAKGVSFIHNHNNNLTHGNIKSTNILIDVSGNAHVADFGLSIFTTPSNRRSNGYRAPESSDGRKQSQKSDVYAFGVLLMEILTGKCPSAVDGGTEVELPKWVQSVVREEWTAEVFDLELMRYKDAEEDMVTLLQIALTCTAILPDQRPKISHVVKRIEELRDVASCHDTLDSVYDSPSLSDDATGAGGAIH
ncbi:probable leucine-rich repeat receptor-like protein kinase At1g68400 [Trifolium pratense]|uniref:probable leucine-rich repeat receptor-like protein kinase At1g68400 n=1 Tax=Trifolium pratense TaxID=57577 RepID=UPI001E6941EA|nr:probable leucine-rich repeat receptor-like protein kinase At1g68400 [Trifolium pratense]